ncbi:iron hydrogenase, partial [Clostridium botulinum]
LFEGFNKDPANCYYIVVDEASIFGSGFGAGGGLTAAIENYIKDKGIECEFKPVKVSGGAAIKKTMMMAKMGRLPGNFIEGMMCEGGCIIGSGKILSPMKAKASFNKVNQKGSMKNVLENSKIDDYKVIDL